jgi:Uma2 family endonuclease
MMADDVPIALSRRGHLFFHRRAEQPMGMPSRQPHSWTYEEVLALIDEQEDRSIRYEFADGELLVTPAPVGYHQRIILDLFRIIDPYVRLHRIGEVRLGPSPLQLVPKTIFQPDLYVVPSIEGRRPRADVPVTSSLLVVEVLSPGSRRHDRLTKRLYYQRGGVPEYWIVDQDAEVFERWQPQDERPAVLDNELSWHPTGAPAPLAIDLRSLFRSVLDD